MAGVGTGGTITGVGEVLKGKLQAVLVVAVEPARSPVLQGGRAGIHAIQGIGASFVPGGAEPRDLRRDHRRSRMKTRSTMSRRLCREEGLLVGISAGRERRGLAQGRRSELGPGKRVVTVLCDTGERYLTDGGVEMRQEDQEMPVNVYIPTPFRKLAGNQTHVAGRWRHRRRGAGQPGRAVPGSAPHDLRRRRRDPRPHQHLRQQPGDPFAAGQGDAREGRRRDGSDPRDRRRRQWP